MLVEEWIAFCSFHLGDYQQALHQYKHIKEQEPESDDIDLNIAVCMFYLGMYDDAQKLVEKLIETPLKQRLLFHLALKFNNEEHALDLQQALTNSVEDQLSLASMHYLRAHYQEAIDIYKKILLDEK